YSTSWASNATLREQFEGLDLSFREYFTQPKQTLEPYYSTLFEGIDGSPRLSVSYPIMAEAVGTAGNSASFSGVIVATIEVKTIGQFVHDKLSPDHTSSVGLLDRDGVILYSSSSTQNVGKNIFDEDLQSALPADIKEHFN